MRIKWQYVHMGTHAHRETLAICDYLCRLSSRGQGEFNEASIYHHVNVYFIIIFIIIVISNIKYDIL